MELERGQGLRFAPSSRWRGPSSLAAPQKSILGGSVCARVGHRHAAPGPQGFTART